MKLLFTIFSDRMLFKASAPPSAGEPEACDSKAASAGANKIQLHGPVYEQLYRIIYERVAVY